MSRYSLTSNSPFIQSVIRSFQAKGLSESTQRTYIRWVRDFLAFYGNKRHPKDITEDEVAKFITHIAVDLELAYNSQNQALCALVHVYKYIVKIPLGELDNLLWANKPKSLPTVYSQQEAKKILANLEDPVCLMVKVALCAGLRISECLHLKIKNIEFDRNVIRIYQGKGNKDRETYLPLIIQGELKARVDHAKATYQQDRARYEHQHSNQQTTLPLEIPPYEREQYLFTSETYYKDKKKSVLYRKPFTRQYVGRCFRKALEDSGLEGKGTFHCLRHTFASFSFHNGVSLRELQVVLGHSSIKTTQIYTHLLPEKGPVISPLDTLYNDELETDDNLL